MNVSGTEVPLLLHSMATPDRDATGCLAAATRLGLDGIELIIDSAYPSAVAPDARTRELAALRGRAASAGLRIAAVVPYDKAVNSPSAAERRATVDALRRAVDIADALGAGHVRVLAGTAVTDEQCPAALDLAAETLRPVAAHAAAAGVGLNLENHMDTIAVTATRTRALADRLGEHGSVGILYDQANLALTGGEPAGTAVALQQPLIRHVHVKNHVPAGPNRRPVGLADGVVDWRPVVRALLRSGYRGGFTFEYERRWFPGDLPPPETGLPADRDLLRRLIDEEGPT